MKDSYLSIVIEAGSVPCNVKSPWNDTSECVLAGVSLDFQVIDIRLFVVDGDFERGPVAFK